MMSASVVIPMEQFIMAAAEIFGAGCTELSSLLRAKLLVGLERINIPEAAYVSNLWLLACLESGNAERSCSDCSCCWTLRRTRSPLNWSSFPGSSTLRFLANRGLLVSFGPFRFHN